jgi:DNA-directed RNA polymerase specialized sigma24 family protein
MTREDYGTAYQNGFNQTVRFLLSRGTRNESAVESSQAAWVKGWERLAQLRDEKMVTHWVNSIALNHYRNSLRKQATLQTLPELPGGFEPNVAAIDLDRVLAFIPLDDRLMLKRQMEGVSINEIARDHNVSDTAIRLRLHRARRTVRSQVLRGPSDPRLSKPVSVRRFKIHPDGSRSNTMNRDTVEVEIRL